MFAQELTEVRSGKNCELAQTIYDAIRMKPEERVGVGERRRWVRMDFEATEKQV